MTKISKEKGRYFMFLLYPESMGGSFEEVTARLASMGKPMEISPLHDRDKLDPKKCTPEQKKLYDQGQVFKKPHYHVLLDYGVPVTQSAVRNRINRVLSTSTTDTKAVSLVQFVSSSVVNAHLYLTHESVDAVAKGKHKYDKRDITVLSNFDISRYAEFTDQDKQELFLKITDLIADYQIPNIIKLDSFLEHTSSFFDIERRQAKQVMASKSGLLRLYFDGAYQQRGIAPKKVMLVRKTSTGDENFVSCTYRRALINQLSLMLTYVSDDGEEVKLVHDSETGLLLCVTKSYKTYEELTFRPVMRPKISD